MRDLLLLLATAALLLQRCKGLPVTASEHPCENPWPEPGQKGATGPDCTIPVFGGTPDGSDMSAWCRSDGCSSLEPGAWACFAVRAPW